MGVIEGQHGDYILPQTGDRVPTLPLGKGWDTGFQVSWALHITKHEKVCMSACMHADRYGEMYVKYSYIICKEIAAYKLAV